MHCPREKGLKRWNQWKSGLILQWGSVRILANTLTKPLVYGCMVPGKRDFTPMSKDEHQWKPGLPSEAVCTCIPISLYIPLFVAYRQTLKLYTNRNQQDGAQILIQLDFWKGLVSDVHTHTELKAAQGILPTPKTEHQRKLSCVIDCEVFLSIESGMNTFAVYILTVMAVCETLIKLVIFMGFCVRIMWWGCTHYYDAFLSYECGTRSVYWQFH